MRKPSKEVRKGEMTDGEMGELTAKEVDSGATAPGVEVPKATEDEEGESVLRVRRLRSEVLWTWARREAPETEVERLVLTRLTSERDEVLLLASEGRRGPCMLLALLVLAPAWEARMLWEGKEWPW
jgi:hypothetical protein